MLELKNIRFDVQEGTKEIEIIRGVHRQKVVCVLDEAQYIKNATTLTTKACKRVVAQHRFALTGTPIENRLGELWSIFDFLMPGFLGSYKRFRERFEMGIVGGDEDLSQRLAALVGPFMMRRLKADVLRELPDKLETCIVTQMLPEYPESIVPSVVIPSQRIRPLLLLIWSSFIFLLNSPLHHCWG